ncbi:hypothetical protein COK56_19510 [Bacillus cereus]|nr:hypothetical protein CON05_14710 [Bacillus cereus]PFS76721.1 hypothetical protein COK56_19510 [Bacillus cereus]
MKENYLTSITEILFIKIFYILLFNNRAQLRKIHTYKIIEFFMKIQLKSPEKVSILINFFLNGCFFNYSNILVWKLYLIKIF